MNEAIKTTIETLASPLAESLGLSIWGVEISGAGRPVLRIFVEKTEKSEKADNSEAVNGCNIDDCAELSRLLGLSLDVEDVMSGAYSLEISSPGLERSFFHPGQMTNYIGKKLTLILNNPLDAWPGRKRFQGKLLSVDGDEIVIHPDDSPLEADPLKTTWQNIQCVRLVHDFNANKGAKHPVGKARS